MLLPTQDLYRGIIYKQMFRTEKDSLGEKKVPADALYGIHSLRAKENFPSDIPFHPEWYQATGTVKLACYNTYKKYRDAADKKTSGKLKSARIENNLLDALSKSAAEVAEGKYFDNFIIPAVQGGAGTSINMNVNEIITNVSLLKTGNRPGDYNIIDPIEHANIFQSTNDVIPSSLTVAVMRLLIRLEDGINLLRQKIEEFEKVSRNMLRPGYTQMQEAVPASFGMLFSSWNEALSRDWWRVSKCNERIKVINLGGGAAGTGISVPRFFIMEVVPELRRLTNLPLSQSENLPDATSNLDKWVEIHSTLKAHAVNLEKIAGDTRLLASDLVKNRLLSLPKRQVGSSIMPGKVNPVIPEFVISSVHKVYANDQLVTSLSGQGCLELNAYLPVIGNAVLESIKLLISADLSLLTNLFTELVINESEGYEALLRSPSITTALLPSIGYNKASELAKAMKEKDLDIFEANRILRLVDEVRLAKIVEPGNLLKLGFTLEDI
jgi:aspartate ammonia-lyase